MPPRHDALSFVALFVFCLVWVAVPFEVCADFDVVFQVAGDLLAVHLVHETFALPEEASAR